MSAKMLLLLSSMLSLCACQALNQPVPPSEQAPPQTVVFKAALARGQGIALNFHDTCFRYGLVKLENRKDSSMVLSKTVSIHLPTVFRYAVGGNDFSFTQRSFIAFPGDTINIEMDAANIVLSSNRPAVDALNRLLQPVSLKAFSANNYLFKDFAKMQDSLLAKRAAMADSIQRLSARYPIPSTYTRAFLRYNNLLYYNESFKLQYETYTPQYAPVLQRLQSLRDALFGDSLLGAISCTEAFLLIYNTLRATHTAQNIKNTNLLNHAAQLDHRLHRTQVLSGYLLDYVDAESHTLSEKEKNIAKVKPFLTDKALLAPPMPLSKLPENVLAATLLDKMGKPYRLQSLLSATNKKMIVLDFWASWCVPCIAELPAMKRLVEKYRKEILVVAVSIDLDKQKWLAACKKHQIADNAYLIADGKENPLIQHFDLSTIPRYILLDNMGNLISDDFYRPSDSKFEISLMETYRRLQ
jgi:thiol-disulfide isomerase/thioredoxin